VGRDEKRGGGETERQRKTERDGGGREEGREGGRREGGREGGMWEPPREQQRTAGGCFSLSTILAEHGAKSIR